MSLSNAASLSVGPAHLVDGDSSTTHPDVLAAAVLPNSPSSALVALSGVLAVAAVAAFWLRVWCWRGGGRPGRRPMP